MGKSRSSDKNIDGGLNPSFSDCRMDNEEVVSSFSLTYGPVFSTTLQYYLETARFFQKRMEDELKPTETSSRSDNFH